jgi:hypothetical protein
MVSVVIILVILFAIIAHDDDATYVEPNFQDLPVEDQAQIIAHSILHENDD